MINVVFFSGGRTSAYLVHLMLQRDQIALSLKGGHRYEGGCSESCEPFQVDMWKDRS